MKLHLKGTPELRVYEGYLIRLRLYFVNTYPVTKGKSRNYHVTITLREGATPIKEGSCWFIEPRFEGAHMHLLVHNVLKKAATTKLLRRLLSMKVLTTAL